MKKKIILHIGCEKTGTTSIQNTLYSNRGLLQEEYDTLYPSSLGKNGNHTSLAIYSCNEDKKLSRFIPKNQSLEDFRKHARNAFFEELQTSSSSTVILSSEWLHPRLKSENEFLRLKELLCCVSEDIEIVLYLRRQDKLAISLYSTSLKAAGNYKPFRFPIVKNSRMLPYYYDFLSIYRNWKLYFGAQNIKLRVFDREKLYEGDVVKDFLNEVLNIRSDNFIFYHEDNRSISKFGITIIRKLNYILHISGKLIKPHAARTIRLAVARMFPGKPELATKRECEAFMQWFFDSNHALEKEYAIDTERLIKLD